MTWVGLSNDGFEKFDLIAKAFRMGTYRSDCYITSLIPLHILGLTTHNLYK
jgi:hypothetical protein